MRISDWSSDVCSSDLAAGLREAYADLVADVESRYGVRPETYGAMGVSAMMHGYLAFDADGELLVPFRTWRNTSTGEAAAELPELRSEKPRGGKGGGSTCRFRWEPSPLKKKKKN